jgi:hypothetical protein
MNKRTILIVSRLTFGVAAMVAIMVQLIIHISNSYSIVNFFSYFTNLANLFAAVVLLLGAFELILHTAPSTTHQTLRGASVVYMIVVGVVFSLLLQDAELGSLAPWVNTILHYVMPVVIIVDWLYQPANIKLTLQHMKYWLIFPLVYLAYSLIRGEWTGFYAYPFIDPAQEGGYIAVGFYCLVILLIFALASIVVSWTSNLQNYARSSKHLR